MGCNIKRNFRIYFSLTVITVVCGLLSRSQYIQLPKFVSTYSGDTLWALTVFWILCVIFPSIQTKSVMVIALAFSFCIEFSQLYHAPWIDVIRDGTLGGLVLGYGFKYSDLVCYSVGICTGGILDIFMLKKQSLI